MNSAITSDLWVDRKGELRALCAAIRNRQSKLVWGPPDAGKTALVRRALAQLPRDVAQACCWVNAPRDPRHFLLQAVTHFAEAGDPVCLERLRRENVSADHAARWLKLQPSVRLRAMLFRSLAAARYCVIVDDTERWSHAAGRLLYDIAYRGETPVILLARGYRAHEIGRATRLFWHDGQRIPLAALSPMDAQRLLELSVSAFHLAVHEWSDFQHDVLLASGMLPGAIVKMCALASEPAYQYGGRIKMQLVRTDYLINRDAHGLPHAAVHRHEAKKANEAMVQSDG